MYQLDEKLMADNRAIIALAADKNSIDPELKPGMQVFDGQTKDIYVVRSLQKYNRLLQEDALTNKVHYDLTFAGNITIEKDLIVQGTMTNLESQDLIVKDNIIELNKDETGAGIGRISSGIEINRGTKERARMLYSEQTDRPNTSGFLYNLTNRSLLWIYEDGDVKTLKDFYTKNAYIQNSISIGENLTLEGNALVKGTLTVNLASTLKSTLAVTGATTLNNTLAVTSGATLNSTLLTKGATTLENTLRTKEAVTFEKTLDVTGNTRMFADLAVSRNTTIGGTLGVTGATTLNSTLTTIGNTVLQGLLTVKQNTLLEKNLKVNGTTELVGGVTITGALGTTSITNSGNIQTRSLDVLDNATIGGNITVNGTSELTGAVRANSDLTVAGNTQLNRTLTVNQRATLQELVVKAATLLEGVLTVRELATFEKGLVSNANATFKENVTVEKNLVVNGTTSVSGATNMTSLTLSNDLTVQGNTTLNTLAVNSTSEFKNDLTATNIKPNNIKFRVANGSSLEWMESGLVHQMFGSSSNDATYGYSLFDKSVNDYNMTFKVRQGASKDKGFVFVSDTTPVLHIGKDSVRSKNDIFVQRGANWSNVLVNSDSHKANHSIGGHDFLSPANIGAVKNTIGTPELLSDNETAKPAASLSGRLFFAKDTKRIWQDLGNTWQIIGGQDTMSWDSITGKPTEFNPPIASASVLGGVKIGTNINIDPDGTIHVPKQAIEYTVHVQEFTTTANQTVFTLNKSFLKGRNHVSPFLYGRRVPPSAFTETSDTTITFKQPLPTGAHLEFYVLLIPTDLSFVMKIEEFNVASGQVIFNLTQGKYSVGSNKLKVFLNGALMPRSAFDETSSSQIRLKQSPGANNHVLIEYMYDPLA